MGGWCNPLLPAPDQTTFTEWLRKKIGVLYFFVLEMHFTTTLCNDILRRHYVCVCVCVCVRPAKNKIR